MSGPTTFLDAVSQALDRTLEHPAENEAEAVAILWPDESRQWEPLVQRLSEARPILTLGHYDPQGWAGPAYWLRCVIDGALPGPPMPGIPIVYLPGFSRSEVRAVEEAPAALKPLAELQYRGVMFAQLSGRDWTLAALLQASDARGGLGMAVGSDEATKAALLRAREAIANVPVAELARNAPLRAAYFDSLLTPDIDRDVLRWLDDPATFTAEVVGEKWDAFHSAFEERFGLPVDAGAVTVAQQLGLRQTDAWAQVWRRYAEAPGGYPNIPDRLRAARPKKVAEKPGLFDAVGSWPQENEEAEDDLRAALRDAASLEPEAARRRLQELEQIHSRRRDWVWGTLGKAQLAGAMRWLAVVADATLRNVPDAGIQDIVAAYIGDAWHADDALLRALAEVETDADMEPVGLAASAVYRPWLEVGAERMIRAVTANLSEYPVPPLDKWPTGTCVIFTDGLRYDVARRLGAALEGHGIHAEVATRLAALPTITPTGKPAVTPVAQQLRPGPRLGVLGRRGEGELTAKGLRDEIESAGYQILEPGDAGDPSGHAWIEQGDIDALGHKFQALLPRELDAEVAKLALRIRSLLERGWSQVVVVTDHGWLYLPGGLPKAELPVQLTKDGTMRKNRAARLADGATTNVPVVPWHWDSNVRIAVGPGIRVFSGSPVYEHGGVSPQECITAVLIARAPSPQAGDVILEVAWAGLRARVTVIEAPVGAVVDVRTTAGRHDSSVVPGGPAVVDDAGKATLLVENEALEGTPALLVLLDRDGSVLGQLAVQIGEDA